MHDVLLVSSKLIHW